MTLSSQTPPYGIKWDCDYRKFSTGHKSKTYPPIIGDDKPFDPSPWIAQKVPTYFQIAVNRITAELAQLKITKPLPDRHIPSKN